MSIQLEAASQYASAQKLGRKAQKEWSKQGKEPYLPALDDILDESTIDRQVDLGIMEIPLEKIVGTKTSGRTVSFAPNFMPILPPETEFGVKWRKLCAAHLSEQGIDDPIHCYEYLGQFYVQEGNKRVSVLKSYGAFSIRGRVTRLIPILTEEDAIQRYYEFLEYYPLTKLYQIYFTRSGSFAKLQSALGHSSDYVWTDDDRRRFLSSFFYFDLALQRVMDKPTPITPADALLVFLRIYPFSTIKQSSTDQLTKMLQKLWPDVRVLQQEDPIAVSTASETEEGGRHFWDKIMTSVFPTHLSVAFIHELSPENSNWTRAHEEGRRYLEDTLGDQISTMTYAGVGAGEEAENAIEDAIHKGADVIFATTAPLIAVCRKLSLRYPYIKFLNCSISMPYTGVRTYYSRIYEGKFISGAIAGAICKSGHIGYIASYPIFGVPAGINAFALGAQLTNPNARVELKWSCVGGNPLQELMESGAEVISTLDIPLPGWEKGCWGTFRVLPNGAPQVLSSPYWDWGTFYVKLIRNILDGGWDNDGKGERAVNYWWDMESGVIGVEITDAMPQGVRRLAKLLQQSITNGSFFPFAQRIRAQDGTLMTDGTADLTPEQLLHMDWLCNRVDGSIPTYEELLPQSRRIVQLQGVYRDRIPPEKEGLLL
ncbi:MAG: BMP family ABC transporter substrate-binding protein [Oscillospiraceae bacterium]|nr:BMP family ABC transporter substrate-binding protein [Oscillospiraceae bacterium]